MQTQSERRTATATGGEAALEHLFEIEWRTHPEAETIVGPGGREGAHIGDGDGLVTGPELSGTVRFSFYTAECPYDPGFLEKSGLEFADVGDHVCRINPGGVIETADGASIQIDVKGFGLRLERALPLWSLTGGVRFLTADERYRWLNDLLGVWEGEFNEETGVARYRVHARRP